MIHKPEHIDIIYILISDLYSLDYSHVSCFIIHSVKFQVICMNILIVPCPSPAPAEFVDEA